MSTPAPIDPQVQERMTLLSIKSILKEIAKCEVVCANDHARRTARRAKTIRWKLAAGR